MKRLKANMKSIRHKLLAMLLLLVIPLTIMLIVNTVSSANIIREQVAQSTKNMLSLYMNQSDLKLQEVDKFLFDVSEIESDIIIFDAPRTRDEGQYSLAKVRLKSKMLKEITRHTSIDTLFIYSLRNKELILTEGFGSDFNDRNEIRIEIANMVESVGDNLDYGSWQVWKGENQYYIYHIVRTGETYVGAWVESSRLLLPLNLIDLGEDGISLLTDSNHHPITSTSKISNENIQYQFDNNNYTFTGNKKWLIIGEPSQLGGYNHIVLISDKTILQQLPLLQRITTIILLSVIVILLLLYYFVEKVVITPIKNIVNAMRKLRDGNWNIRMEPKKSSMEFEVLNETFNQMITEIHTLKIDVYEEKLKHQRAELKHLQLQINPHFFMNSLNIIYNLATVKDFALVQEMTRCLVTYFRFMFKSNSYFVSLRDELSHTSNYLRIQQLRFPESLFYQVEADQQSLDIEVPPLIVQMMVENTIKYVVSIDQPITIDVQASVVDEQDRRVLYIYIRDTGPGFPEEILQVLNKTVNSEHDGSGEKIGIWNVRRRLKLLYDDQATVTFYNEPTGHYGAVVKFEIVLK